ncbi:hypothetical protein OXX59_004317, partial [Metschnikowia pulcherrima]
MYQQSNQSYDSVGRRSSHNPFRQSSLSSVASPPQGVRTTSSVTSSNTAFDDWVTRNRGLMSDSSDDEEVFQRPSFPTQSRTGSDTNVNYS